MLTASPSVNNEGRRKNAPSRESNPGSLVDETSALTIEPRELVFFFNITNSCSIITLILVNISTMYTPTVE